MTSGNWILDALGNESLEAATTEASRRRLRSAVGLSAESALPESEMERVAAALELQVYDLLDEEGGLARLRTASAMAFQAARALKAPQACLERGAWLVRVGCLASLGDRAADFRRLLDEGGIPDLPVASADWGERVWGSVLDIWLRLMRKRGWQDLDAVHERVAAMRRDQRALEPAHLSAVEETGQIKGAWLLVAQYHLARAAEVIGSYLTQGVVDGHFDVREQAQAQFDRADHACAQGQLVDLGVLTQLLAKTAQQLVDNSIWTVTRAVNTRVTKFVKALVDRSQPRPIFEMLPPQRKALREEGLLGSGHRSVVVSLPTSSGKTIIAQFRILQALNQFAEERGWVAYLAPTRALVNQMSTRLRGDFGPLGISVERVSPALEVDSLEASLLEDSNPTSGFRVLVTTPEKLDLMLRMGWEAKIGRPLTLVVVDEAHGIGSQGRGIKLELLLATINRECQHAQFLLLTPFIPNAAEIAKWLAPESHRSIELGFHWSPNDRAILIGQPKKAVGKGSRGNFEIGLRTLHTSRNTLSIPEELTIKPGRPLGLTWSDVSMGGGKLAAAVAETLRSRGTVVVLADQPAHAWGIAQHFKKSDVSLAPLSPELETVRRFLVHEMGDDFPLSDLLSYRVAVHHGGMSDDARTLVEWLTEKGEISVLVATTTIAQGVNFPVSAMVLASHQYPYGNDMPPEDFWNIAGRAGRVDQGDLGLIALAATDDEKAALLVTFVQRNVDALNSTLVDMVKRGSELGHLLDLESLSSIPEWSSFLQYLAHTYRQIGDHDRFALEVEQVLRGTLGFQSLRRHHPGWAAQLITGVYNYASHIRGKPLKLVDATGFSWESVWGTLGRLHEAKLDSEAWRGDLFGSDRRILRKMMGVLLQVPELRTSLQEVTGGEQPDGAKLAQIVCDWVQGSSLQEMALKFFSKDKKGKTLSPEDAMTKCCRSVFGRLTQTAAWGLSALQALTVKEEAVARLSDDERRDLRNLPSHVYYGVQSNEALALRMIGVPRTAAGPLAAGLALRKDAPLSEVRAAVRTAPADVWRRAMGDLGDVYRQVWSVVEGER